MNRIFKEISGIENLLIYDLEWTWSIRIDRRFPARTFAVLNTFRYSNTFNLIDIKRIGFHTQCCGVRNAVRYENQLIDSVSDRFENIRGLKSDKCCMII